MAWVCILSPQHILELTIKIITKQKALARRPDGNEKFLYLLAEPNRYKLL